MEEIIYDRNRINRCGFPEFIYGEGKTLEHLVSVICEIRKDNLPVIVTRLREEFGKKLMERFQEGKYDERSKCFFIKAKAKTKKDRVIGIVTAGTCDLPVAYEAINTLDACGYKYELISDVGVAGIHRLFERINKLKKFSVLIVIAGMEGALPSVIGGLLSSPIIAVPTSVGYGSSMKGLVAMFAMLNSCSSGITVVNIDNGFGAACAAMRIVNTC
ncbi:MAG TPA: nickel pincer cofactor biosynthesis protein LarB [Victivallales bacterium]|nr:nickel pincer cofactor biosynthesis protein LarB [Victivallales bacterium]HPO91109.1 nickel pincer cofactor biosynthesis protein LarB [Victivallales bacterium]HRR05777.1 nickel pincer cofactor biosynthesis protein LarB [Victivallales bacterium]HRR28180.1 nickel pincer cofactor biosynthesis protein LarB [Victivallales bacterium]HRU02239.1 nickel pincer cofactor biosynthesis protein LarB [Victivallales bacterium]